MLENAKKNSQQTHDKPPTNWPKPGSAARWSYEMGEHRMQYPDGWREMDDQDLVDLVSDDLDAWLDEGYYDETVGFNPQEPTKGQVGLYAVFGFERSIWFEGVDTTLGNSDGVFLPAALEGYRLFGIPACERVVRKIIQFCEFTPYPYDRGERQQRMPDPAEFAEQYEALYEDFEDAMTDAKPHPADYIREHPDEFFR